MPSSFASPDRAADSWSIATVQSAYGIAVDRRDWTTFRQLFTPDVVAEYPGATYSGIDEWVEAFIEMHNRFGVTHHAMTNHVAVVEGDLAYATCYGVITMSKADGLSVIESRIVYEDEAVRTEGTWRIWKRLVHRQFRHERPTGDGDDMAPLVTGKAIDSPAPRTVHQ